MRATGPSRAQDAAPRPAARGPHGPGRGHPLVALQRVAGNRAVTRLLQRKLDKGSKGRVVKVWWASQSKLVKGTLEEAFDVKEKGFRGSALVRATDEWTSGAWAKLASEQVIEIAPALLYTEATDEGSIVMRHGTVPAPSAAPVTEKPSETKEKASEELKEKEPAPASLPPVTVSGGQLEKASREVANKLAGNELLIKALDTVAADKTKKLETVINGFTVAKDGKQLMVVLFRKMEPGEAKAMVENKAISRKAHTDPYKWFSETLEHSATFSNAGGSATAVTYRVYLDGDAYLKMRIAVNPEYGQTAAAENRFHQERLGKESSLINFAVHSASEAEFNKAIVKIEAGKK